MKFVVLAVLVASASCGFVKRDAVVEQDAITTAIESLKKHINTMSENLSNSKLQEAIKSATKDASELFKYTVENIASQVNGSSPDVQKRLNTLKDTVEKALIDIKDNVKKDSPEAVKKFEEIVSSINEKTKNFSKEIEPQVEAAGKAVAEASKQTLESLAKVIDEISAQVKSVAGN